VQPKDPSRNPPPVEDSLLGTGLNTGDPGMMP
jgi:hypothetical protein